MLTSLTSFIFSKGVFYPLLVLFVAAAVAGAVATFKLYSSLPVLEGEDQLPGILAPVAVKFDEFGVPLIIASSRLEASQVLGFVSAQERLFQMDLLRRKSSGRLAEIFGEVVLDRDLKQRPLGFERAAAKIASGLVETERNALEAYTAGVNQFLSHAKTLPPEFLVLGYTPEPWRVEDSVLVALYMFQLLSWTGEEERMLSIMEATLPEQVTQFLTPDTDRYSMILMGGAESLRPIRPIPVAALADLRSVSKGNEADVRVDPESEHFGSNSWAVNFRKTGNGRAILANDMHLPLTVPNIWYRANLRYENVSLSGVTFPGLPFLIAGSNEHVAWGFTNALADVMDLVTLRINPTDSTEYLTPSGWVPFELETQWIRVKGGPTVNQTLRKTRWGPVLPTPLLGRTVAVRWTALDPDAVNLGLMEMDKAETVEQGIGIMTRTGGPPMNVILADDKGHIAWTLTGRFPNRNGFKGAISRDWVDESIGWAGFLSPDDMPRIIDPPSGFLTSANNRVLGREYPYIIGHNFAYSYRAYRISQLLRAMPKVKETDLFSMQLDTQSEFYEFYRRLLYDLLNDRTLAVHPDLEEVRQEVRAWDGRADKDSRGLGVLAEFRKTLAQAVFPPFLGICRARDPGFVYKWFNMETPLRQLLTAKNPKLLPNSEHYTDWDAFIIGILKKSVRQIKQQYAVTTLTGLTWGRVNQIKVSHPLSHGLSFLGPLLDMPKQSMAGCSFCIKVISNLYGASERLVISPGRWEDGLIHMPGGQSGHPFSPHYSDQHRYWVSGSPLPFWSGDVRHVLNLFPADDPSGYGSPSSASNYRGPNSSTK